MNDLRALEDQVLSFIKDSRPGAFLPLLNAIVRYQRRWNPRLNEFWKSRGFLGDATHVGDVPAVPTDVFRHVPLHSIEGPVQRTFRTSGTTSGRRGESLRLSTRLYEFGALHHARNTTFPLESYSFINLVLDPKTHPDSSLSHMVELFNQRIAAQPAPYYLHTQGLDVPGLCKALEEVNGPTVVFGTAFAFVALLDDGCSKASLPEGSLVIETGGFKGKSHEVSRKELYPNLARSFGVPLGNVRSEYSMTELSSQLYSIPWDLTGDQILLPPAWCQVSAVDPVTLESRPHGEEGLLRFVDLANVDTVVAIQTSDQGRVSEDGSVRLKGRALGATPRGCSLAIEEILQLQHRDA